MDLRDWSDDWEMLFNVKMCKLWHYGFNYPVHTYTVNDEELTSSTSEKDVGVYTTSDLKSAKHCVESVKKQTKFSV